MTLTPDIWFKVFQMKEPFPVERLEYKDCGGGVIIFFDEDGSQSDTMIVDGSLCTLIGCFNGDTCSLADIDERFTEYENGLEAEARKYLRAEIRKWLQYYGITHEELARKINYSKETVDMFMKGKRNSKNVESAIRKALHIDENIGKIIYDES